MVEKQRQRFGEGYEHGYIFGRLSEAYRRSGIGLPKDGLARLARRIRAKDREFDFAWGEWDTSLDHYAIGMPEHFGAFLVQKAREASAAGQALKVLDIGVGSAVQWKKVLELFPNIEFSGTTITPKEVVPSLRRLVKLSTAANIHKKFPANHFDVVVSHMGIHGMEFAGIENAMRVLKPGGHAIITGDITEGKTAEKMEEHIAKPRFYSVLSGGFQHTAWSYHLQKNKPVQTFQFITLKKLFLACLRKLTFQRQ